MQLCWVVLYMMWCVSQEGETSEKLCEKHAKCGFVWGDGMEMVLVGYWPMRWERECIHYCIYVKLLRDAILIVKMNAIINYSIGI